MRVLFNSHVHVHIKSRRVLTRDAQKSETSESPINFPRFLNMFKAEVNSAAVACSGSNSTNFSNSNSNSRGLDQARSQSFPVGIFIVLFGKRGLERARSSLLFPNKTMQA